MIVTTEYIYHNPLREEIGDIVKNTKKNMAIIHIINTVKEVLSNFLTT